jgi:glycosyltransferase involved in cell wall biosynthesis
MGADFDVGHGGLQHPEEECLMRFKPQKSAGVPVTSSVKRLIGEGDRARDAKDWAEAARAYGAVLREDPSLVHIWVQLGHAEKEFGNRNAAEAAYRQAAALDPDGAEALLHLGHLRKLAGDAGGAARLYFDAACNDPGHPDALAELHRSVERDTGLTPSALETLLRTKPEENDAPSEPLATQLLSARDALETLVETLRARGEAPDAEPAVAKALDALVATSEVIARLDGRADFSTPGCDDAASRLSIVFDASDLIAYFRNARLPTGIQRVQIETITSALDRAHAHETRICCFTETRDAWLEAPADLFIRLARLSLQDGGRDDPKWIDALNRLQLALSLQESFEFPQGAFLVNLGTSWWLQNYFLYVREAKRQFKIRYIPFVHDLIPVLMPEHCIRELTQDFISWVLGVFDHADAFLTNSNATKRDLIKVAATLGRQIPEDAVAVVPLDADIRKPMRAPLPPRALSRWSLDGEPFVLFVSTVESRKNHLAAFDAWMQLMRNGTRHIPRLVCVGNNGWLNDAVYARLAQDDKLRARVTMLSQLSDDELDLLYRSCLFTIYPSLYEGWGLPVTESLCHGKTPLVADAASLPEAGGSHAVYFQTGSIEQFVAALRKLIFDDNFRQAAEAKIRLEFKPRTWRDIAAQIETEVRTRWSDLSESITRPPQAKLGFYHPIVRNRETRIWRGLGLGEIYRAGTGWWWPDDWGCWTKPQGGDLTIGLPDGVDRCRIYLHLKGLPSLETRYELSCDGAGAAAEGSLGPGEGRWILFETRGDRDLRVRLRGAVSEALEFVTGGLDRRHVSVGLSGFFLCPAGDLKARQDFLEAVSLGDLGGISAYKEVIEE